MTRLAVAGGERAVPQNAMLSWPVITRQDEEIVLGALRSGKLWGTKTPEVVRLEDNWAEYVGAKYCIATNSGTAALHMAVADKYASVIEFLVSKGARLDVKDKRGYTPLSMARTKSRQFITGGDNGEVIGDAKIAAVLENLGAKE